MTNEPLVLYGSPSPNVVKVGIMLEELEVPYELRLVSVFAEEQYAPDFLAMNPIGKIPVLVDPAFGKPMFESGAILFYLAERYGKFFPTDAARRYEVMQWLMVQMAWVGPTLGQLTHFRIVLKPGTNAYAEGRFHEVAKRVYRILDERLCEHAWIAGDTYSIADMAVYPWMHYLERHTFAPEDHKALVQWRDKIAARPAVVRSGRRFKEAFSTRHEGLRTKASAQTLDRFFGRPPAVAADYSPITKPVLFSK
jgi:GST-like protein